MIRPSDKSGIEIESEYQLTGHPVNPLSFECLCSCVLFIPLNIRSAYNSRTGLPEKRIFPMIESGAAHCNLTEKDSASYLFSKSSKSARYFEITRKLISFCQITSKVKFVGYCLLA